MEEFHLLASTPMFINALLGKSGDLGFIKNCVSALNLKTDVYDDSLFATVALHGNLESLEYLTTLGVAITPAVLRKLRLRLFRVVMYQYCNGCTIEFRHSEGCNLLQYLYVMQPGKAISRCLSTSTSWESSR